MSDWDKLMDPARNALEALIANGDEMADRIKALTAERDAALLREKALKDSNQEARDYLRERDDLKAKLAEALKTLEFYGDERNYEGEYIPDECGCCGSWYEPKIHKDGQDSGDKARTTLAELTGGKDE